MAKAKIYTRKGDGGSTSLFGGSRIRKDDLRVEAYAAVDEFAAVLAMVRTCKPRKKIGDVLARLHCHCFVMASEIASDKKGQKLLKRKTTADDVKEIEKLIDQFDAELKPLSEFIMPVESTLVACLNLARVTCRRAERRIVALSKKEPVGDEIMKYINRVSDLIFTLLRYEREVE